MADETTPVQDPDDEPTPYARVPIRPDQAVTAAEAAMADAMATKSNGRR